ncbi:MAG: hypothetical protein ACOH13_09355 [Flavobacteriales bacterium]
MTRPKSLFRSFLHVALALFGFHGLSAQPLILQVAVNPPYSASYIDYFSDPAQVAITVVNTSQQEMRFYFAGSVSTLDENHSVTIPGGTPWNADPLVIGPGTTRMLTGADLQPAILGGGPEPVKVGITDEQIIAGVMPEGMYQLCLTAYDYDDNTELSNGLSCSNIFTIRNAEPPVPISPACEEVVIATAPQLVIFNWIMPTPPPPSAFPEYHFRLVRLWDATNAQAALETSADLVYETSQPTTVLVYNQTLPALIAGQQYAWWVQATTSDGSVVNNNGYMAPCTFTYKNDPGATFALVYPFQQDTLPWTHLPIIAHFQPHPDTTGAFHSTLTKVRNDGEVSVIQRKSASQYIKWNSGPYKSQRFLLEQAGIYPGEPFTPEMANYINIYKSDVPPSEELVHGSSYDLSAYLQLADYDLNDVVDGYVSGNFVSGMGKPIPIAPANDAFLAMDGDEETPTYPTVPLQFRTAENPVDLFPPYPIWIIGGDGPPTRTEGFIFEKWRLQVSRSADIAAPVFATNGQVGANYSVNTKSEYAISGCDQQCVADSVYKDVTVNFMPQDTGWYYWRVGWLKDILDTDGPTYHDCSVRRFHIGTATDTVPPAIATTDTVPPAQCLAECRRTPTPGAERIPVSNIHIGDTIQVGLFKMRVQQIAFSGGAATGEGLIDVPVLKASLRVNFMNVLINAGKRMYDGTVNGLFDNTAVIPPGWTVGGSLAAGFNPEAAQTLDTYLNTAGRLVSQFAGSTPMGLPIGIDKETPDGRIVIGILGVQFTDTIARLCAGVNLPFPSIGTNIGLGNMSVPFHPGGIGDLSEEGTLFLLDNINVGISGDTMRFKGVQFAGGYAAVQDSGTFVSWDCKGFRAFTLDAQWRFSKDRLKEDLANGEDGPDKIIGSLKVRSGRAGIFGRVDFNKPFHMDGAKGWGFEVQDAWLDMASYMNPPEMSVSPQVALAVGLTNAQNVQQPTWEGFYLKRALLRMPPEIQRTGSTERTSFLVDNMIINGTGLTASIKAVDLIDVDGGSMDGWGYSMDTLQLDITANSFQQAGFKGQVHLPITDTLLNYSAMIAQDIGADDYYVEFLLHPDGLIPADFWKAKLDLQPTSYLRAMMMREDTAAFAKVVLNGSLTIDGEIDGLGWLDFRDIRFQGLTFETRDPYTNADESGVFSLASPQKYMGGSEELPTGDEPSSTGSAGGFPVSITRVEVERRNLDGSPLAGLAFDINLQLTGETNIFTATTRIAVLGELNTTALHEWGHHSVDLDSIGVSGETGAVKIEGGLRWYNDDATYGDGINGSAHAWFMKGALEVAAAVQFGNKDGLRYWFADAMIAKDNGFSPGSPFNIYGFGGGAWYKMRRNGVLPSSQQITDAQIANQDDADYTPGLTLSHVTYVPDASKPFGFEAKIIFGDGAGGTAYNGDVTAGMTFTTSGGVETAFMDGNAYMLSERDERDYVPIHGTVHIAYDYPNDIFSANFQMYISIGTHGQVVGTGPGGLAGGAELYISPDTWHLFVGTPQTPIGLDFDGLFEASAYFMVGEGLPAAEPPDPVIMAILPPNFFTRSGDIATATGLAFGARAHMDGHPTFWLLKLDYAADLGFDLLLQTAESMVCDNVDVPGINGWYASGKLYAYLMGAVSLHVDLWFASGDFEILKIAAAAMLQGGFAEPSWVQGAVAGSYSILQGCVSGSFTFQFEEGEPCQAFGDDVLAGLEPIDDISPHHLAGMVAGSPGVDVGITCEALLKFRVGEVFQMEQVLENGSSKVRTFKLLLDKFELKQGDLVKHGQIGYNAVKDQVLLMPDQYLEPITQYSLMIQVRVEEQNAGTGLWATAQNDGVAAVYDSTVVFKTGEGLKKLDDDDVRYSYPLLGQRYLLQDECRNGAIMGKADLSNQKDIVGDPTVPNMVRVFKMVFTPRTGGAAITAQTTFSHWTGGCAFNYVLPQLLNNTTYIAQLIGRDSSTVAAGNSMYDAGAMTGLMVSSFEVNNTDLHNGMAVIQGRTITGYSVRSNEKLLYTYHFRTSSYNTLSAKVAVFTAPYVTHTITTENPPSETLIPSFVGEAFDEYDMKPIPVIGLPNTPMPPLVHMNDPNTATWQTLYTQPVFYDYYGMIRVSNCTDMQLQRTTTQYSWPGGTVIADNPDYIGIPPYLTVKLDPFSPCPNRLNDSETAPYSSPRGGLIMGETTNVTLEAGESGPSVSADLVLRWETAQQVRKDYLRLQTITADMLSHCSLYGEVGIQDPLESKVITFNSTPYKPLTIGNYKVAFFFQAPTCPPDADTGSGSTNGIASFRNATGGPELINKPMGGTMNGTGTTGGAINGSGTMGGTGTTGAGTRGGSGTPDDSPKKP